jgi:AraC-like DNA-binding protein
MTRSSSAPQVQHLRLDSFSPKELDEAVSGGAVEHVQLGAGRFVGELVHADLGDRVIDFGAYNLPLLACGGMPTDRIVLGFVTSDSDDGNLNGTAGRGAAVVVLAEGNELHYRLAPRTRWLGFHVGRAALEHTGIDARSAPLAVPLLEAVRRQEMQQVLAVAVETLRAIERHDPQILDPAAAGLVVAETLTAAFGVTLPPADATGASGRTLAKRRLRLVNRTREFFEAHLAEPIQVTQLCKYAGASVRTLERACFETYGANPKQLLTLMRMARVRRALLGARSEETTVARIAADNGFFHLGRFSATYATLYGEPPSATLRA